MTHVFVRVSLCLCVCSQAEQIWSWTKTEGGNLARMSRADIQEMLASGTLAPEVDAMVARHRTSSRLCQAAALGDIGSVDEILEQAIGVQGAG